jgi:multicomponent Na+:H+ antiporter subunit D
MMGMLPFFVVIPLGASFLAALLGRKIRNASDCIANLATLALLFFSLNSLGLVSAYKALVYRLGGWMPGIGISLVLDGLSSFMLVTVNLISFLVTVYSISYMRRYTDKWKFHALFMLMLAGMNGMILSGDIFNLYVFLEMASISGYVLVAFGTEPQDLEASFKYAIMGALASIFILLGIALLYSYTSTLNMADISFALADRPRSLVVSFVCVLFLAGFGLKAALVPFHAWLADAHSCAPTPVSAMLSGVLIKVLGVYALMRIFFNVLGVNNSILGILMFLGAVSMLAGVLLAVAQWDFKRLLAYHSISQIGYVILGIGLGTPLGILGGLFHLFNHSVFKSLLFLNSGAVEYSLGTRDLQEMGGLRDKMPVTANTSLIASVSISGIPPFNGFWSKIIIIFACIQANHFGYAFCAVVASVLTLVSFMKVQKYAFMGTLTKKRKEMKEVPLSMKLSMIILAVICVIGGVLLIPAYRPFLQSAVNVLLAGNGYKEAIFVALR